MIHVAKKEMIEEIKQKIDHWNEYSDDMYGYTLNDAKDFLKKFRIGVYDCGLNGILWFGPKVNSDLLVCWDADRRSNKKTFSNISEENLIVYSMTLEIKNHLNQLKMEPIAYGRNYHSPKNGNEQTPPTKEDMQEYEKLFKKVLTTNYTWREAREIRKNYKMYNIYENKNFPHEPELIAKLFTPEIKMHFPSFYPGKCTMQTQQVEKLAKTLLEKNFTKEKIMNFLTEKSKNNIEEYIKRQIISIIDFKRMYSSNKKDYESLKNEFKNTASISTLGRYIIFNDNKTDELLNLIKGLLTSLATPTKNLNVYQKCQEFKQLLNCNKKHPLITDDGKIVEPLIKEKHEKKFIRFQKKYEFLCKKTTELEFIEGCLELLGDFLNAQLFERGNKEIAICLFNAIVMSRGILPPVIDLNENNYSLLNKFVNTHEKRYIDAIPLILKDTVTQTNQFNNQGYFKEKIIN